MLVGICDSPGSYTFPPRAYGGITPAARGAGGVTRRVIGMIDPGSARLGVSSVVRASYRYWMHVGGFTVPWPAVAAAIEEEMEP